MADVLFTALGLSFFLVRLAKGSWVRNPVYLALAIFGSMAGLLILMRVYPGAEDSMIFGNLAALAGAGCAISLYDLTTG